MASCLIESASPKGYACLPGTHTKFKKVHGFYDLVDCHDCTIILAWVWVLTDKVKSFHRDSDRDDSFCGNRQGDRYKLEICTKTTLQPTQRGWFREDLTQCLTVLVIHPTGSGTCDSGVLFKWEFCFQMRAANLPFLPSNAPLFW